MDAGWMDKVKWMLRAGWWIGAALQGMSVQSVVQFLVNGRSVSSFLVDSSCQTRRIYNKPVSYDSPPAASASAQPTASGVPGMHPMLPRLEVRFGVFTSVIAVTAVASE